MPDHNANLADLDLLSAWPAEETSYVLVFGGIHKCPGRPAGDWEYAPIRDFTIFESDLISPDKHQWIADAACGSVALMATPQRWGPLMQLMVPGIYR